MKFIFENHDENLEAFYAENNEKQICTNYNLTNQSIIFDVGAYHGNWSYEMYQKYNCIIYCFEPTSLGFSKLQNKLSELNNIFLYQIGLGGTTREENIVISNDGSSLFIEGNGKEKINIVSMSDMLKKIDVQKIDLIKINIEGAEYELLENIIDSGLQERFNNYQIQFHPQVENYAERYDYIINNLSKTHKRKWFHPYIWESWEIIKTT